MLTKFINPILILLTLASIVSSTDKTFTMEEIQQLQEALDESSVYMAQNVQEEDAVICIGGTRAGKSTFINYLIGTRLTAIKGKLGRPMTIKKAIESSAGPEIGGGSTSKTKIPTRWISKRLKNVVIWDSPGFDDNRGPIQDITNAFYLYQLLQKVKSLRIALVIDVNNLFSDNIQPFVSVLNSVEGLLGHKTGAHLSSLSVIFTKVPNILNEAEVDKNLIIEFLKAQFLESDMKLSETSKDIVRFLVHNDDHIAFFKRPMSAGLVTNRVNVNIFPAIKNSSPLGKDDLKHVHPSISDSAKIHLFHSRNTLLPVEAFSILEKVVSSVIGKIVNQTGNDEDPDNEIRTKIQLKQLDEIDKQLLNALDDKSDFSTKIRTIESIDTEIEKIIKEHNLLEKVRLMQFVDKQLGLEESTQLSLSLKAVLLSSSSKVKVAKAAADLKLGKITQKNHDKMMKEQQKRHEEEMAKLQKEQEESKKRNDVRISWIKKFLLTFNPIVKVVHKMLTQ